MAKVSDVLVKPLITEKASSIAEKFNRYGFKVELAANKNQIKNAVESLYDVKVISVKTAVLAGKTKRAGTKTKKMPSWKKAFVELAQGQKIEFFKGV